MNQQQKNNQHCRIHPNQNAIFCCFKKECNQSRIFCFDCLKQKQHIDHMDAVQKLEDANIFINQQLSKVKKVIATSKKEFELAEESFNKLIQGLQYQVFGLEAVMNDMNLNEIEETITNLFLFEKVQLTIQQSIEQPLCKLRKTIEDTYQNCQLNLFTQKDEEILVKIGSYLFEQQQYKKAIEYYDECLDMNLENEQALFGKGECLRAIQQFQQASECYQKVQSINDYNAQAYIKHGECLQYLHQFKTAIKVYNRAIYLDESDFASIYYKGYCLLQLLNFTKAKKCFEKVIEISSDMNYTLLAKSMINCDLGNLLLISFCPEEAKQILDQIQENSPQKFDAFLVNTSFLTLKISEDCRFNLFNDEIEQMISLFPQNIFALYLKGISLMEHKNYEEAQKIQKTLIEIDPTSWMIQHLKVKLLNKNAKYDQSLDLLEQMLAFNPENIRIIVERFNVSKYSNQKYNDDRKKSKNYLEYLLIRFPKQRILIWIKGLLLLKKGKFDKALLITDTALSKDPDNVLFLISKANALKELEEYEEAINLLHSMIDTFPENKLILKALDNTLDQYRRYNSRKQQDSYQ